MRKNSFASFERFRMVVIETKSEIMEMNDHEMASYLNNGERFVRLSYTFLNRKKRQSRLNQQSPSSTDVQFEVFKFNRQWITSYYLHPRRLHETKTSPISMHNRI